MPKISVIVPVYNVEKYLRRCVDSILSQTFTDFELILVDDGSPDGCPGICEDYREKDTRVRVIHKENGGLSSARNAGLDAARGEWIYFCDSDDYIEDNLLERCVEVQNETGADFVRFNYTASKNGNIVDKPYMDSQKEALFDISDEREKLEFLDKILLEQKICWSAWGGYYRAGIIVDRQLRFADNKIIFAEDMFFSLMFSCYCNKVYYFPEMLYHYILRDDSIMGKAKSCEVSRMNELSKTAYNLLEEGYVKDNFYIIHKQITIWQIRWLHKLVWISEIYEWDKILQEIGDKTYFKGFYREYYKKTRCSNIKQLGLYDGMKENLVNRYLAELNVKKFVSGMKLRNAIFFWKDNEFHDALVHLPNRLLIKLLGAERYEKLKKKMKG